MNSEILDGRVEGKLAVLEFFNEKGLESFLHWNILEWEDKNTVATQYTLHIGVTNTMLDSKWEARINQDLKYSKLWLLFCFVVEVRFYFLSSHPKSCVNLLTIVHLAAVCASSKVWLTTTTLLITC